MTAHSSLPNVSHPREDSTAPSVTALSVTSESRRCVFFLTYVLSVAAMCVVCAVAFAVLDDLPWWFVLLGGYLPLLSSLAIWAFLRPAPLAQLWRLGERNGTRLARNYAFGAGTVMAVGVLSVLALMPINLVPLRSLGEVPGMIALGLLVTLGYSLVVFGEEVVWRGQAIWAFGEDNLLRTGAAIGVLWAIWHIPMQVFFAMRGILSPLEAVGLAVALVPTGMLWHVLAVRGGSIWPAVAAHACPLTFTAYFLGSPEGALPWLLFTGLPSVITVLVAIVLAQVGKQQPTASAGDEDGPEVERVGVVEPA